MKLPYTVSEQYSTKVGYFSMEFAIHQALKIYSGGLGFLAGSHMRSAFDLKQNVVGVGILWTYGYYDQGRDEKNFMIPNFRKKRYSFLEDTGIIVDVRVNSNIIKVKAFLLKAHVFKSAPIFLLTTDIPENDFLSRTITHKLYDSHNETRLAQEIILGIGGAKVLDVADETPEIYHMNEGHSLPLSFYLYDKFKNIDEVRRRIVFTTHTPEKAGNEEHGFYNMQKMGFFSGLNADTVRNIMGLDRDTFSLTVGAIKMSKKINAVSKIHAGVSNDMWERYLDGKEIIPITNAQNRGYWMDKGIKRAHEDGEDYQLLARKRHNKKLLFDIVADQTGKLFDPEALTIVWARRFAEYKRASLITRDMQRFRNLMNNNERPVQIIWAGKPHSADSNAINIFNQLIDMTKEFKRAAVLVGYELALSKALKKGADIWLNNPRYTREASGTSGMTASFNGALHFSINDGWHPEFAQGKENSFTIVATDENAENDIQDDIDHKNMMDMLENVIVPMYYTNQTKWIDMMNASIKDSTYYFNSSRMAKEYYDKMYDAPYEF